MISPIPTVVLHDVLPVHRYPTLPAAAGARTAHEIPLFAEAGICKANLSASISSSLGSNGNPTTVHSGAEHISELERLISLRREHFDVKTQATIAVAGCGW